MDSIPPELLLEPFPDRIREATAVLRRLVRQAVPEATEKVRSGWRLIGYDVPVRRRSAFFAYIAPEPIHVHLGFEVGVLMADPDRVLEGAHLRLRKVRYLTFEPGGEIPEQAVLDFIRDAARIAAMTRQERLALALEREWRPDSPG